eukprot:scaffold127142_cov35-Tisochrysis_lutea.AAC.2
MGASPLRRGSHARAVSPPATSHGVPSKAPEKKGRMEFPACVMPSGKTHNGTRASGSARTALARSASTAIASLPPLARANAATYLRLL